MPSCLASPALAWRAAAASIQVECELAPVSASRARSMWIKDVEIVDEEDYEARTK
jgi:hypothetical protein